MTESLASSSYHFGDTDTLLKIFLANEKKKKRPRLLESDNHTHFQCRLTPPSAPTPTLLPLPTNPPQVLFLAQSRRTHNRRQDEPVGLPKLVQETGLVIHQNDQALLDDFDFLPAATEIRKETLDLVYLSQHAWQFYKVVTLTRTRSPRNLDGRG